MSTYGHRVSRHHSPPMMDPFISLYNACFPEDEKCLDLFFPSILGEHNRYFVESDGHICSALYLVQKTLHYRTHTLPLPYVVGLATDPAYRNNGHAKQLLVKVYQAIENLPFVALFPFRHAFYERLGFATPSFDCALPSDKGIPNPHEQHSEQCFLSVSELKKRYDHFHQGLDFYIERSESYFAFLSSLYARDGQGFVPYHGGYRSYEEVLPQHYQKGTTPGTMVRIVNLPEALRLTNASTDRPLRVVDPLIDENNVTFTLKNGEMHICSPRPTDRTTDISELTNAVFGQSQSLSDIFAPLNGHLADKY